MKITSVKKDIFIYSFITVVFAVASVTFLIKCGTSELLYLLFMLILMLLGAYFLIGTLRFRITWDTSSISIREGLKPERKYSLDDLQSVMLVDQVVVLLMNGKKYGFSQGCPNTMEFLEFLEQQGKVKL